MILRQSIERYSVSGLQKKIKSDSTFLASILTPAEIRYCRMRHHMAESAAARIAAKTAFFRIFKFSAAERKAWRLHLSVIRSKEGKPFFKLSPALKRKLKIPKNQALLLSLAHERTEAIAWVVLASMHL